MDIQKRFGMLNNFNMNKEQQIQKAFTSICKRHMYRFLIEQILNEGKEDDSAIKAMKYAELKTLQEGGRQRLKQKEIVIDDILNGVWIGRRSKKGEE